MIARILSLSPRVVGMVVGAVLTAFVVGAFSLSSISFGTTGYTAEFARTGGARTGDEVRIAGVSVGKVTRVELDGNHVLISFTVDSGARLGKQTRAQVKLATLLGNTYLEITPDGADALADRRIPLAQTQVTFDLQNAIEAGGSALGKLDGAKFREALQVLAGAYRDTPAAITETLDGLSVISRAVADRREEIAELIDGASAVVSSLQRRSGDLVGLMEQSDLLLGELVARRDAIHSLIAGARSVARELSGAVQDNVATVGPMLAHLNTVTDTLESRADDIDAALKVLAPMARYTANLTGNGPWIDIRIPYLTPDNALCRVGVIQGCR